MLQPLDQRDKNKAWRYKRVGKEVENEFCKGSDDQVDMPSWTAEYEWAAEATEEDVMASAGVGAACLFQKPCYLLIDAHASCTLPVTYMYPERKLQQHP